MKKSPLHQDDNGAASRKTINKPSFAKILQQQENRSLHLIFPAFIPQWDFCCKLSDSGVELKDGQKCGETCSKYGEDIEQN